MKNYLILSLAVMLILLTSCKGGQLFLEVRSTYNLPTNHKGQVTLSDIEKDISKVRTMGGVNSHHDNLQYGEIKKARGWDLLQPQFNITYRQYIFDNKKYSIKEQLKKK